MLAARRHLLLQCAASASASWPRTAGSAGSSRPLSTRRSRNSKRSQDSSTQNAFTTAPKQPAEPSLVEQLFPEESKRYQAQLETSREVPRLPLDTLYPQGTLTSLDAARPSQRPSRTPAVLILWCASQNLTEEDFRRLVPQGKHIEGWALESGDILKVIPSRDMRTLAQNNLYYLLFSSEHHATTYMEHVKRIHDLAATHMPTSLMSPIPPPPGYMLEGLDLHSAIEAYTLIPPSLKFDMHLPAWSTLPPIVQTILQYQGYPPLIHREHKMPFEARLTLEGPDLHLSVIRSIIYKSGQARRLSWSGDNHMMLNITRWELGKDIPHEWNRSERAKEAAEEWQWTAERLAQRAAHRMARSIRKQEEKGEKESFRSRTANAVYIVGFNTERALQSFVAFWHRQPLIHDAVHRYDDDPDVSIANVELCEYQPRLRRWDDGTPGYSSLQRPPFGVAGRDVDAGSDPAYQFRVRSPK